MTVGAFPTMEKGKEAAMSKLLNSVLQGRTAPQESHLDGRGTRNGTLAMIVALHLLASAAGCATKQDTGVLTGGVLGGVVGSTVGHGSTGAVVAGSVIGAVIGGAIGRSMDQQDRRQAYYALEHNRTQEPYSWRNPDNGNSYAVTPTRTYETRAGQYCREYQTDAVIDGRRESVNGIACRQPDGSWQATG